MRAASTVEKSQDWRKQTATMWERLGYEFGRPNDSFHESRAQVFREPAGGALTGQHGMFHVISYDDWRSPDGQPLDGEDARRHHRAWAYQWAAEESETQIVSTRLRATGGSPEWPGSTLAGNCKIPSCYVTDAAKRRKRSTAGP